MPSHLHELLRKYYRAYEKLEKELGRDPTRKEIAKTLKLPLDRAEQLQSMVREPISLEKDVPGTDSRKVKDTVEDPNPISASDGMDLDRLGAATRESIEALGDRERKILHWRFGLEGEDEHTLEQIGKKLGLLARARASARVASSREAPQSCKPQQAPAVLRRGWVGLPPYPTVEAVLAGERRALARLPARQGRPRRGWVGLPPYPTVEAVLAGERRALARLPARQGRPFGAGLPRGARVPRALAARRPPRYLVARE